MCVTIRVTIRVPMCVPMHKPIRVPMHKPMCVPMHKPMCVPMHKPMCALYVCQRMNQCINKCMCGVLPHYVNLFAIYKGDGFFIKYICAEWRKDG